MATTKTVGMVSSYPNLSQTDWLWQQTPQPFGVWGNIQMLANANKPDFLLLYQYDFPLPKTLVTNKWKFWQKKPVSNSDPIDKDTLFKNVPKERIIYLLREPPLPEVLESHFYNYHEAKRYCGYISGPDDYAPNPHYMPAIWYHLNSFRDLDTMGIPEKNQSCCWITSGTTRSQNHLQRLAFLQLLKQSQVDVTLYGRGLPNWANSQGIVINKWNAIAPYYYNLAIENYTENKWYVSEKLWDALLAWCLPIYYGGEAADKLLPPGSFLRLPSLDEKGISYIKEVTASLDFWHQAKEAIAEARQIILYKLNLLEWLSNFVTKFD